MYLVWSPYRVLPTGPIRAIDRLGVFPALLGTDRVLTDVDCGQQGLVGSTDAVELAVGDLSSDSPQKPEGCLSN
jgi:hypothetical protein